MSLEIFLTKQSESAPTLSDFFTDILGYFDKPWEVTSYIPNVADYDIVSHNNEWHLRFNTNLIRLISRLDASNKNLTNINPQYFGLSLQEIYINNNLLTCNVLNNCLNVWATNLIVGKYLSNIAFDFNNNNNNINNNCLNYNNINLLLSRGWIMTSEYLYSPDNPLFPTPTPTITPSATDAIYTAVQTIGGIGTLGDRDGIVKDTCDIPVVFFPSPTPTITSSRYVGLRVDTIAGSGPERRGSRDGSSCVSILNSSTPTATPTVTPTPTTSNLHILLVRTIGGI